MTAPSCRRGSHENHSSERRLISRRPPRPHVLRQAHERETRLGLPPDAVSSQERLLGAVDVALGTEIRPTSLSDHPISRRKYGLSSSQATSASRSTSSHALRNLRVSAP